MPDATMDDLKTSGSMNILLNGVIKHFSEKAHENAVNKGFFDPAPNFPTLIALMHSELSEALEADRKGNLKSDKIPGFSKIEEELADLMIYLLATADFMDLNLDEAIVAKMKHNATRPHKHGGKGY